MKRSEQDYREMEERAYSSGWMWEKPRENTINVVRTTPKFD
tara:strand:- start:147 stop:269 length:123 start_codon:yes stop_codon:yes gene_type:complete